MIQKFENQTFERFLDRSSGAEFSDLEFRNCRFVHCDISVTHDPQKRSMVRNVQIVNCATEAGGTGPAVFEDVLVDGLKTDRLVQLWAAVFKHVTLSGKIGRVMFSGILCPTTSVTTSMQQAIKHANTTYYENVDWALDISRAEFYECEIRGIPGPLIRRDVETQAIVTRAKAQEGRWKELSLSKTYWGTSLSMLLNDPRRADETHAILVAPKRHPNFHDLLAGIKLLREAGVAEPE